MKEPNLSFIYTLKRMSSFCKILIKFIVLITFILYSRKSGWNNCPYYWRMVTGIHFWFPEGQVHPVWNLRAVIWFLFPISCLVHLLFLSCHFSANGPFSWFFPPKIIQHCLLRVRFFVWLLLSKKEMIVGRWHVQLNCIFMALVFSSLHNFRLILFLSIPLFIYFLKLFFFNLVLIYYTE